MDANRRNFFARLATMGAAMTAGVKSLSAQARPASPKPANGMPAMPGMDHSQHADTPAAPAAAKVANQTDSSTVEPFLPVLTPDLGRLPYKLVDGVKEFYLIAEVVNTKLVPERPLTAW